jgi:hypothetical protein
LHYGNLTDSVDVIRIIQEVQQIRFYELRRPRCSVRAKEVQQPETLPFYPFPGASVWSRQGLRDYVRWFKYHNAEARLIA